MVVARSLAQRRQIPFRLTALPIYVSRTFLFLGQVEAKRKPAVRFAGYQGIEFISR